MLIFKSSIDDSGRAREREVTAGGSGKDGVEDSSRGKGGDGVGWGMSGERDGGGKG